MISYKKEVKMPKLSYNNWKKTNVNVFITSTQQLSKYIM